MSIIVTKSAIDEVKLCLDSLIEVKSQDSLKTHFRDIFLFKNAGVVNGGIGNNDFRIWIQHQGRWSGTGVFYPIILGRLIPMSDGTQIELKTKINAVGLIFTLLIFGIISYGVITGIVIQEDNNLRYIVPRVLISILFLVLWMLVPILTCLKIARIVKKYLIDKIFIN